MAQMIAKPQSATTLDRALAAPARVGREARTFVDRFGWRLLLWRLVWAPWWLVANRPAPDLPARAAALPADLDAPGLYVARTLDRLRGKIQLAWLLACFVRGLTLGVIVATGWLLVAMATGLPRPGLIPAAVICAVLAASGLLFAALSRPSRGRLARMLDRTYLLDERVATAVESLERPSISSFGRQIDKVQRADAANQLAILHPSVSRGSLVPWREIGLLLTGLTLFCALAFANDYAARVPDAESGVVPAFVPASDRLASLPQNQTALQNGPMPQIKQGAGNALLGDLNQLGNALDKSPSTQQAAKAIQSGNYSQAASSLQSSAANADKLSPDARNALANQLDRAADQMSGQNQDLQSSTRQAANGLRQGGTQAQQGMSNLANSVNKAAGQTPQQAQSGQPAGQTSQGAPANANSQQAQQSGQQGSAQQQPNGQGQNGTQQQGQQQQGSGTQAQPGTSQTAQDGSQNSQQNGNQQSGSQTSPNPNDQQGGAQAQQGAASGQSGSQGQTSGQDPNAQGAAKSSGASQQSGSQTSANPSGVSNVGEGAGAGNANQPAGSSGKQPAGQQNSQTQSNGTPPKGTAAKPPAGSGSATGNDQKGLKGAGSESVALSGSSNQMVQAGQDPASSSQGSGANSGAAQGSAQQGAVGAAGPDTNRVPAGYRGVVSAYFDTTQP